MPVTWSAQGYFVSKILLGKVGDNTKLADLLVEMSKYSGFFFSPHLAIQKIEYQTARLASESKDPDKSIQDHFRWQSKVELQLVDLFIIHKLSWKRLKKFGTIETVVTKILVIKMSAIWGRRRWTAISTILFCRTGWLMTTQIPTLNPQTVSMLVKRFKMAEHSRTSTHRPVFKHYTLLEAVEEILNDQDSGDEDLGGEDESDSGDEETDNNQHHPLLL